ncbi:MAG: cupin domain-containing protein [Gammaproteobacteria bacterium]|nr:cupin domain-containing protein [Gammaproteobacteria bacterium]
MNIRIDFPAVFMSVIVLCTLPCVYGQPAPSAADIVKIREHPLTLNEDLGVATARIGAGRLHQIDATIIEIPAGGKLPAVRHLAEEIIYIIAGQGYTNLWVDSEDKMHRYEWDAGDLLSPSLNAWHQHFNTSADAPVRYISITTTPITSNLFHDADFLASSDFVFTERWTHAVSQQPEYTPEGGFESSEVVRMRVGHLLPNLPDRKLRQRRKGAWGITILPEGDLAGNHVLEMEVREKDGEEFTDEEAHLHRHPWEVVYIVLDGRGFSYMQRQGEPLRKVNWQEGDLFIAAANEYHDNRSAPNTRTRYLQVKAAGYFRGVGDVGGIVLKEDADR